MSGEKDKAKGSAKEGLGELAGDHRMKSEGKTDKAMGSAKMVAENAKESAKGVRDSLKKD